MLAFCSPLTGFYKKAILLNSKAKIKFFFLFPLSSLSANNEKPFYKALSRVPGIYVYFLFDKFFVLRLFSFGYLSRCNASCYGVVSVVRAGGRSGWWPPPIGMGMTARAGSEPPPVAPPFDIWGHLISCPMSNALGSDGWRL